MKKNPYRHVSIVTRLILIAIAGLSPKTLTADDSQAWAKWKSDFDASVLPIIKAKCSSCHNHENAEGELNLAKYENGELAEKAGDMWERVAKRVRQNEMPPPDSPGLTDPEKSAFHRWVDSRPREDLCNQIATDETQSWYKGYVMSRRLSRYEYGNAIFDLTALGLRAKTCLLRMALVEKGLTPLVTHSLHRRFTWRPI